MCECCAYLCIILLCYCGLRFFFPIVYVLRMSPEPSRRTGIKHAKQYEIPIMSILFIITLI